MMNKYRKLMVASAVSMVLVGCGGGDSNNSNTTTSPTMLTGRAIDDYIANAEVFLDLNFNGVHDSFEPSGETDDNGLYQFSVEGQDLTCSSYVPVVVNAIAGVSSILYVDGSVELVDSSFSLITPPSILNPVDTTDANITPFTSAIYNDFISSILLSDADFKAVTESNDYTACDLVKDNHELKSKLLEAVDDAILNTTQGFGIPTDELYSDYVASGDTAMLQTAREAVAGLKLSLEETIELSKLHDYAAVSYGKKRDQWRKRIMTVAFGDNSVSQGAWSAADEITTSYYNATITPKVDNANVYEISHVDVVSVEETVRSGERTKTATHQVDLVSERLNTVTTKIFNAETFDTSEKIEARINTRDDIYSIERTTGTEREQSGLFVEGNHANVAAGDFATIFDSGFDKATLNIETVIDDARALSQQDIAMLGVTFGAVRVIDNHTDAMGNFIFGVISYRDGVQVQEDILVEWADGTLGKCESWNPDTDLLANCHSM